MIDYTLLQKWTPSTHNEFHDLFQDFIDNPDLSDCWLFNSLEELVEEFEYQGFEFEELVQFTKNRYGTVLEIIEDEGLFYTFYGWN